MEQVDQRQQVYETYCERNGIDIIPWNELCEEFKEQWIVLKKGPNKEYEHRNLADLKTSLSHQKPVKSRVAFNGM